MLLVTYALVTIAAQSFAGVGDKGIGLDNSDNAGDVLSVLGKRGLRPGGFGTTMSHLLILMVLTSAAASTQTTILPTARTSLSMAVYRALPRAFARIHPRHLTPSVSTVAFGVVSIVLYAILNYSKNPTSVIGDCRLRARPDDRLLLRPHRVRLRLVLPPQPAEQRAATCFMQGVLPLARRLDPVLRPRVEPA